MAVTLGWVSALLPSACALCGDRAGDTALCDACWQELPRNSCACPRCARPMAIAEICARCIRIPPAFDAAFGALIYRYPVDILVTRAKYNGDLAVAKTLGELLANKVAPQVLAVKIDVVIPIPLSPLRQRERGYNQTAEIARVVARGWQAPLLGNLIRIRETEKQADLTFKARLKNVRDAFSAASLDRPLQAQHVALVDDVMTTGATLNEAAKALKAAGAARVTVVVVARAISKAVSAKISA